MASSTTAPKAKKPTLTFMLHHPDTMADAGKYNSTSHRNAALKAATKGFNKILLRQTNTKTIHEYEGSVLKLDEPKQIPRGDRFITYAKKPVAKFIQSYEYNGANTSDAEAGTDAEAPQPEPELKPKKAVKNKKTVKRQEPEVEQLTEEEAAVPATQPASEETKPKRQIRRKNV